MLRSVRNLLDGMGLLCSAPRLMPSRLGARLLYVAYVPVPGQPRIEFTGTELFAEDPIAADWLAVGNDMRVGIIKYLDGIQYHEDSNGGSVDKTAE